MLKDFEKSLVKTIRAARPNLKQSSIQTYVANPKRLGNMLNLTKYKDLGFLKDTDRVLAALEDCFLIFYTVDARTQRIPHHCITTISPVYHHCITTASQRHFLYLKRF